MQLATVFLLINYAATVKIIFNGMHSSASHIASMLPVAYKLRSDGYAVHFLESSTIPEHYDFPKDINFTHIRLKSDPFYVKDVLEVMWTKVFSTVEFSGIWETGDKALTEMLDEHYDKISPILNESWDLVIADELFAVSSYALAMKARKRGKPFITFSTCIPTNLIKYHLALGTPFTLRPAMYHRTAVPYQIERFANRLHSSVQETYKALRTQYATTYVAIKGLVRAGVSDFDFSQLASEAAYYFLDDVNSLVFPSPVSSGIAEVGFHCPTTKQLPKDYEDFVNDPTSKGTILLAFGSNVVWDYAPHDIMLAITKAIDRLKEYRVIFSYNGSIERIRFLGSHVMITPWAPQKDLLAHNKTVLFMSHGGLKSLKDTICGGVPVVYIPLFAEQSHNGEVARAAGFAEILQKHYLTADVVAATVRLFAVIMDVTYPQYWSLDYPHYQRIQVDHSPASSVRVYRAPNSYTLHQNARYKESILRMRKFYLDRIIPSLDLARFCIRRSLKTSPRPPALKRKGITMSLFTHVYAIHFIIIAAFCVTLS